MTKYRTVSRREPRTMNVVREPFTCLGKAMRFLLPVFSHNSDAIWESPGTNLVLRDWSVKQ